MKSELCDSYTCIRWQLSDQFILVSVKQHAIISVIGISVNHIGTSLLNCDKRWKI